MGEAGFESCWFCNNTEPEACPVCNVGQKPVEDKSKASLAVVGQDGWCAPEDARFKGWVSQSLEAHSLQILQESEAKLKQGDWKSALESVDRVCRALEQHINIADGKAKPPEGAPVALVRRGERELLCFVFAHRARCQLLKQDYPILVDDCKRFGRLYNQVLDSGDHRTLQQQEQKVLSVKEEHDSEAPAKASQEASPKVLGHMVVLGAAAEIASQCRDRVGRGFAPALVLDNTAKALRGLELLDFKAFPGLNALRAHLRVTRSQASLELQHWAEAKKDAELALTCDPGFREAEYLLKAAEDQEW